MNKNIYLFLVSITILLLVGTASAALCKNSNGFYSDCGTAPFNHRYQGDPDKSGASNFLKTHTVSAIPSTASTSSYRYNTVNTPSKPIFPGPYDGSRYQLYASGDYRPSLFFNNYGNSGYGYSGYGYGGYGNNNYGYNNYGYNNYGYNNYGYSGYNYPYYGNSYSYSGYAPYYSGGYLGYPTYYSSYYNPYYSLLQFL